MAWNNVTCTCKGASVIAEAMKVNTTYTLQKLNISGNAISDDGAIAFNESLGTNKTLIEFNMSGNYIALKSRIMQSIEQAIKANQSEHSSFVKQ